MIDTLNLVIVLTCLGNLCIAIYALSRKERSKTLLTFVVLCILLAMWNLVNFIAFTAVDVWLITLASQLSMLPTAFIPSTFLYFALQFRNQNFKRPAIYLYIPSILILPFIFTKYNIAGFDGVPHGSNFIPGPLYTFYSIYFLSFVGAGLYNLLKLRRNALTFIKKRQVDYILFGALFSALFGISMTVILPLLGMNSFSVLGTAASCIFTICSIYSITHYRLFGIKFVLREFLRKVTTFSILFLLYSLVWMLLDKLLGDIGVGVTIIVIILSFQYLKKCFSTMIDPWFNPAQPKIKTLDIKNLRQTSTYDIMKEMVKAYVPGTTHKTVQIFIFQPEQNNFLQIFPNEHKPVLIAEPVIPEFVQNSKEIIITEELTWKLAEGYSDHLLKEMHTYLTNNYISVLLPIIDYNMLIGFILLGEKTNKTSYMAEDTIPLDKFRQRLLPVVKHFLLLNSCKA